MTIKEISENLCYYDKRNPDCTMDDEDIESYKSLLFKRKKDCSCDNCFYGRTKLAEELLKILSKESW